LTNRILILSRLLYALFAGILVWAFYNFGATQTPVQYRLFLILLTAALIGVVGLPLGRLQKLQFLPFFAIGLFLLAQTALQGPLTGRGYLIASLGWLALFLTLLLIEAGVRTVWLVFLLIVLGGFEALYGLAQSLAGFDYIGDYFRGSGGLATGTLINRNHFAGLLNMTIPLAVGGLFAGFARRRGRSLRWDLYGWVWLILLCCSVMGLAVVLSLSKGGSLTLVLTLLFIGAMLFLSGRKRRGINLPAAAAWLLLFAIVAVASPTGMDPLLSRFEKVEASWDRRATVYADTLQLISDHPALGVGPGMYRWRFRPYQSIPAPTRYSYAHNEYLQSAADWGIPLALLFWGFVGWRFYRSTRVFLESPHRWQKGISLGCSAAIFAILFHSLVDFNLQIPANWMMFCMILGLSWIIRDRRSSVRTLERPSIRHSSSGRPIQIVLVVVMLGAGWNVIHQLAAREVSGSSSEPGPLEEAIGWEPREPDYHFRLGLLYRDEPSHRDLAVARYSLEKAVDLNPYNWEYWLELARSYEVFGSAKEAEEAYLKAISLNPRSGSYRWQLANFYLRQQQLEKSFPHFRAALEFGPAYREQSMALLQAVGETPEEIARIWPDDKSSRLFLLKFLAGDEETPADDSTRDLVKREWKDLLRSSQPPSLREGDFYISYLLEREPEEARAQWILLMEANGLSDADFRSGPNLIWNGGFENPVLGRVLDWRLRSLKGYSIERAAGEGVFDSQGLRIDFEGSENLTYIGMQQQLVIAPQTRYEFSFRARSKELSTDQGVYVQITAGKTALITEQIRGTTLWTRYSGTFLAPTDTDRALIRLVRKRSRRIDNLISGTVWLDDFQLKRVPETTKGDGEEGKAYPGSSMSLVMH